MRCVGRKVYGGTGIRYTRSYTGRIRTSSPALAQVVYRSNQLRPITPIWSSASSSSPLSSSRSPSPTPLFPAASPQMNKHANTHVLPRSTLRPLLPAPIPNLRIDERSTPSDYATQPKLLPTSPPPLSWNPPPSVRLMLTPPPRASSQIHILALPRRRLPAQLQSMTRPHTPTRP
ncbi:hypothetical protein OF83DRAFT_1175070 [Amylostereum chailletii]|nr:hypothetical protein OF83DRAFT_1175070 [Amylostereum chailletii]